MAKRKSSKNYNSKHFIIGIVIAITILGALNYSNDSPPNSQKGELANIGIVDLFSNLFGFADDENNEEDDEIEEDNDARKNCEEGEFACATFPYPENSGCCADDYTCSDEGFECIPLNPCDDGDKNCGGDPEDKWCCSEEDECEKDKDNNWYCIEPGNNDEFFCGDDQWLCGTGIGIHECCDKGTEICNMLGNTPECCSDDQTPTADGCEDMEETEEETDCSPNYDCGIDSFGITLCCTDPGCFVDCQPTNTLPA